MLAAMMTTEHRYMVRIPLRTRSGWSAPLFWETKVEPAFAMEISGILVKENSLRAAVCPAMVSVPSPLMPYCSTTDPADTMLLISPMEMLWLNSSQYKCCPTAQCLRAGSSSGTRRITYRMHSTTEMPCAMTVATAAPCTPMPSPAMNHRSSATFSPELMSRNTSGITLLPMARSSPAHRL